MPIKLRDYMDPNRGIRSCDWCGSTHPEDEMEPEEGDEWICRECYERDLKIHGPIGVREPKP